MAKAVFKTIPGLHMVMNATHMLHKKISIVYKTKLVVLVA
jgi:hypothetical protein